MSHSLTSCCPCWIMMLSSRCKRSISRSASSASRCRSRSSASRCSRCLSDSSASRLRNSWKGKEGKTVAMSYLFPIWRRRAFSCGGARGPMFIIGEFIRIARFVLTAFFKLFMTTKRTKNKVLRSTSFLVLFYLSKSAVKYVSSLECCVFLKKTPSKRNARF